MSLSRRHMITLTASALSMAGISGQSMAACNSAKVPMGSINGPPEYLPGAPIRQSFLEDQKGGQKIRLFGAALDTNCNPLIGARLDFWQTDSSGKYDVTGYKFRGAQYTNERGGFTLDTLMPGPYAGVRHVHLLLATRPNSQPQPLFVSGAVFLPTAQEYANTKPSLRTPEFISPDTLHTVDGVLMVPCDIILELA